MNITDIADRAKSYGIPGIVVDGNDAIEVYETVKKDGGWQNGSSKDCGNIVTKAIEIANRKV